MNKIKIFYLGLASLAFLIVGFYVLNNNLNPKIILHNTQSLNDNMIKFLQDYIKIDTSHPTPDYDTAINFLKNQATQDGFSYQEVNLKSGKKALLINYPGKDKNLKSILLNHHMDVVPADDKGWIKPPFSGEVYDGAVIGRGTQDMKGIGVMHYFALKQLKDNNITPERSIYLLAIPDEEIGGFTGTKEFVEAQEFKDLNIGYILDEGHASGDENYIDLKVAERKPIQIEVTSLGKETHGSRLFCDNSIHNLIRFLDEIINLHSIERSKVVSCRQPGEFLSYNITSLTAGIRKTDGRIVLNMVPGNAQATIDIRVPASIKNNTVIDNLNFLINKYSSLSYKILHQATQEPDLKDYKTELYNILSKTIEKFNLKTRPHFFEASSDIRFYLAIGIEGIGINPFTVADNIHGINESVPVDQMIMGKDIFYQFLLDFCL